jgi:hypothetical protein
VAERERQQEVEALQPEEVVVAEAPRQQEAEAPQREPEEVVAEDQP